MHVVAELPLPLPVSSNPAIKCIPEIYWFMGGCSVRLLVLPSHMIARRISREQVNLHTKGKKEPFWSSSNLETMCLA